MHATKIAIIFLFITVNSYYAVPIDEIADKLVTEKKEINVSSSSIIVTPSPPVVQTSKPEIVSITTAATTSALTTENFIEVKIIETSSTSSTSIKKDTTRGTKGTKQPNSKKPATTTTTTTEATKTSPESKTSSADLPVSRKELLTLIKDEMESYEKKSGSTAISSKNFTMISERILQYLIENGTSVGIHLKENKDGTLNFIRSNQTVNKIYGAGSESKFPAALEYLVQRIQAYYSIYKYEDQSRPVSTEPNSKLEPTIREEPDTAETSTLSNDEVIDQLEDEINEYLDSDIVRNVTQIQIPTLIKSAYERIQSWFVPNKPSAKEEPVEESAESEEDSTDPTSTKKPPKKTSFIKSAYEAIESLFTVFDEADLSDEEEKVEGTGTPDIEQKESQDDIEDESAIKETVGENLYDLLKLAYSLYDEDDN